MSEKSENFEQFFDDDFYEHDLSTFNNSLKRIYGCLESWKNQIENLLKEMDDERKIRKF